MSKCIISIRSLEFYRYVVEDIIVKLVAFKVKIINIWPIPKTIHEI